MPRYTIRVELSCDKDQYLIMLWYIREALKRFNLVGQIKDEEAREK